MGQAAPAGPSKGAVEVAGARFGKGDKKDETEIARKRMAKVESKVIPLLCRMCAVPCGRGC